MADQSGEYGTIIGKDAKFTGELSFDGAANVLGTVEGSISSKGKLNVASGAHCHAHIHAAEVSVQGEVEGDVEVTDRIDLQASAQLTGDIVAKRMTMADGASFVGTCRIGGDPSKNGAVRSPAAKPAAKDEGGEKKDAETGKVAAKK